MSQQTVESRQPLTRIGSRIAGAVAFIASVAAVLAFLNDKKPEKRISIYVDSTIQLSPPTSEGAAKEMVISYRGSPLKEPYQIRVRFANDGNVPFDEKDVEAAAALSVAPARIVTVTSSALHPADLDAACVEVPSSKVEFRHRLMNPGDNVVCDIIVDGAWDNFSVSGRISGISAPALYLPPDPPSKKYVLGLPESVLLALLILSSTGAVVGLFVALILALEMLDLEWEEISEEQIKAAITPESLVSVIQEVMARHDNIAVSAAAPWFRPEWVSSPATILEDLERQRAAPVDGLFLQSVARSGGMISEHLPSIVREARAMLVGRLVGDRFTQLQRANSYAKRMDRQQIKPGFESYLQAAIHGLRSVRERPGLVKRMYLSFDVEDWIALFLAIAAAATIVVLIEFWNIYVQ